MSVRIIQGDAIEQMRLLDADSIDAVVTDPPYHLTSIVKRFGAENAAAVKPGKTGAYARASAGFMGKKWDGGDIAMRPETWAEVLRVLKPGGHMVCFGGTRTFHRVAVAIEDAGFEIRDQICWLYGTGFPKSHDVSKGIDRLMGAVPVDTGVPSNRHNSYSAGSGNSVGFQRGIPNIAAPATEAAQQWQGWGTALKPAHEPICLARKPLAEKSIARNVMAHGTGALNIDACRVGVREKPKITDPKRTSNTYGAINSPGGKLLPPGRWPANVCHDGSDEVEAAFPHTKSGEFLPHHKATGQSQIGTFDIRDRSGESHPTYGDSGSAARFFYSGKASSDDRLQSKHPTVKPVALMRWLVRMIAPPGGTVLDPFAGSGTTGMACMREGFDAILIEREAEYIEDIKRRVAHVSGGDAPLFTEVS